MISTLPYGSTGFDSTRILFGAAALAGMKPERVERTLEVLERFGVNHIDTAASYGHSELNLAGWLQSNRDEVFLATKTGDRDGATQNMTRSLAAGGGAALNTTLAALASKLGQWDASIDLATESGRFADAALLQELRQGDPEAALLSWDQAGPSELAAAARLRMAAALRRSDGQRSRRLGRRAQLGGRDPIHRTTL